jgi:uncharacterized protein (DUF2235 family)
VTAIRRLALCLDGTWNNRDDSTNVLHHFGLATECRDAPLGSDTVTQLKFYLEGVGTGPLDKITGGGFGFGLETNVRAAYNWLVQNFEDATPLKLADEIYIFGFSRGAFTARSLVGFISTCGVLRRGAPLTVNELWQNYCLLGREREHHVGPLTALFGESAPEFRRLPDLLWDPWRLSKDEIEEAKRTNRVPGLRVHDLKDKEQLLVRWSRRVQITYLGVYDTVGAVGWDALAIPGVQSRLALHHNMRPTTIIQHCRHALAIDEHRSNFRHTPFVAYIGPNLSDELGRLEGTERSSAQSGSRNLITSMKDAWTDRIEQRWFVGAHSNVGGGYGSNPLAQEPLKWLLDGARRAGLICDHIGDVVPSPIGGLGPTDSFQKFAAPFWTALLRAKRSYRVIDPVPEVRANRTHRENQPGFILSHINEQVDESVARYWERRPNPPPNLVEYARRHADVNKGILAPLAAKEIRHPWMGDAFKPYFELLLWATIAAAGIVVVDGVFQVWPDGSPPASLLAMAAGVFALIDWAESAQNFTIAARGESPPRRAFLDSIYWMRALGVVLFAFGALGVLGYLATIGADAPSLAGAFRTSARAAFNWVIISLGAGLGVGLGVVLNHSYARSPSPPARIVILAAAIGPAISTAVILLATLVVYEMWRFARPVLDIPLRFIGSPAASEARFAGLLLLLQLGLIYVANALSWAGRPMARAYLGSIVRLQLRTSPQRVQECLDRWCSMLRGRQPHRKSACRMRAVVRETLYRDVIGFIPLYTVVFTFGLWFGASQLGWAWLNGLWFVVPLIAAAADYSEDVCHLLCLRRHEHDQRPSLILTWAGAAMTSIKLVAFGAEAVLTLFIVLAATLRVHEAPEAYGWRGLIAFAVSTTVVAVMAGLGIWSVLYRLSTKASKDHDARQSIEQHPLSLQQKAGDAR